MRRGSRGREKRWGGGMEKGRIDGIDGIDGDVGDVWDVLDVIDV